MPGRRIRQGRNEGFTLIELLVVITIIAILAAIAIPVFLGTRTRAYDSTAVSDLRNVAVAEESYLTGHSGYAMLSDIVQDGQQVRVSPKVTVSLVRVDGSRGYCLAARHASSGATWYYDSQAGLAARGAPDCPVTTHGVPGDSTHG